MLCVLHRSCDVMHHGTRIALRGWRCAVVQLQKYSAEKDVITSKQFLVICLDRLFGCRSMLCRKDVTCTRGEKYEIVRWTCSSVKSIGCFKLIEEVLILGASNEERKGRGKLVQEVQNIFACGRLNCAWLRLIFISSQYWTLDVLLSWRVEFWGGC